MKEDNKKRKKEEKIISKLTFNNISTASEKNQEKLIEEEAYIIRILTFRSEQIEFKKLYFSFMKETNSFHLKEYEFLRILLEFIIEKENIKNVNKDILEYVYRKGRRKTKNDIAEKKVLINLGNYKDNTKDLLDKVISYFSNLDIYKDDIEFFSTTYFFRIILKYSKKNTKCLIENQNKNEC